jgi:hypothetical protein
MEEAGADVAKLWPLTRIHRGFRLWIALGWRNDQRSLYASLRLRPGKIAMRTEQQIETAAAAAAEKANGGKFTDPMFYEPEHGRF